MDIAALSMGLSQMKVAQQAGISVMKMAMNNMQEQASDLTQIMEVNTRLMEQSVNPDLGSNIDVKL